MNLTDSSNFRKETLNFDLLWRNGQKNNVLCSNFEALLAFPGKLATVDIRLNKAIIVELFFTCSTNCVLAADDGRSVTAELAHALRCVYTHKC